MTQIVTFEKIVPEGKALGYWRDQACFCIGPLPGELARVAITKQRKGYTEAGLLDIVQGSPHRGEAAEEHFMICSPWQGVAYDYQLALKRQMLAECMSRPGVELPVREMVGAPRWLGYRNKLGFSVLSGAESGLQLGFHERGSMDRLVALPEGCVLGSAAMNATALAVLAGVNELGVRDAVESIIVRQSQTNSEMVGIISVREDVRRDWARLGALGLTGLVVSRLLPGRRQRVLWQTGTAELTERVGGVALSYAHDGFFQVNVPMFEQALERVLAAVPAGARVVDLYGGPGTIGLPVARVAQWVTGIEILPSAVEQARANAERNALRNYEALALPVERMDAGVLQGVDCVIVDPPRAGLHKRVVEMLLEATPARIVYLSCNPVTQARDVGLLLSAYRADAVTGFDFYPGTLHLESLVVLERSL